MNKYLWTVALVASAQAACERSPSVPKAPEPSQLCVVRHAEAYKNLKPSPEGLTRAQLDTLTPKGESQARALKTALPEGVVRVLASPLKRAQQTAELLDAGTVVVEPALRPLDGETSWDERTAAWSRGEDIRPDGGQRHARHWTDGMLAADL